MDDGVVGVRTLFADWLAQHGKYAGLVMA